MTQVSQEMRFYRVIFRVCLIIGLVSAGPAFGKTLKDSLGRSITLDGEPERVIALAPSITEIL